MKTMKEIMNEIENLCDEYVNNKQYQSRLSKLSVELSDAYAEEMKRQGIKVKAINDNVRQSYQKTQKLGNYLYFGVHQTIQILTTKHETKFNDKNPLTPQEEEIVKQQINDLYDWLKVNKDNMSDEAYKLNYRVYLKLKSTLEEIKVKSKTNEFKYKKSKEKEFTLENVRFALKQLHLLCNYDIEFYTDLIQAIKVTKFSKGELIAINEAIYNNCVSKEQSKNYDNASRKLIKTLEENNIYKMKVINNFF